MQDADRKPVDTHVLTQADMDDYREKWNAVVSKNTELEALVGDLNASLDAATATMDRLRKELEVERAIGKALETRLGDVSSRKLALQVAHGDTPPDQFEARRRVEVNGVRDFVAAVRTQLQPSRLVPAADEGHA